MGLTASSIFSSGQISLKDICDAYGVPYNMDALRGQNLYNSDGTLYYTIPSSGQFGMDVFRGKYTRNIGNILAATRQTRAVENIGTLTLRCRIISYSVNTEGKLISLTVENTTETTNAITYSNVAFTINNTAYSTGLYGIPFSPVNTLTIRLSATVDNGDPRNEVIRDFVYRVSHSLINESSNYIS